MRGVLARKLGAEEVFLMGDKCKCGVAATRPIDCSGLGSGIKLALREAGDMARFVVRWPVEREVDVASLSCSMVFCGAGGMTTSVSDCRAFASSALGLGLPDEGLYFFVSTTGPRELSGLWFGAKLG
jgi:hypothetical protein